MRRFLLISFILLLGCTAPPVTYRPPKVPKTPKIKEKATCVNPPMIVAVIDTGLGYNDKGLDNPLCQTGHKTFTGEKQIAETNTKDPVAKDTHGHGTNIAGVISGYAGDSNFCLVILQYYSPTAKGNDNLKNTVKAIKYAQQIGAKIINYSGGGAERAEEEAKAVKDFIDNGGIFVAAAGNERSDLSEEPFYPALDDPRVVVVGNAEYIEPDSVVDRDFTLKINKQYQPVKINGSEWLGVPVSSSNYGDKVNRWELGTFVEGNGIHMTGTSQAAAIATGKLIKEKSECFEK